MDTAIVTIKTSNGQFECDMELPAELPVAALSSKILETLKGFNHHTFSSFAGLSLFCGGTPLDKGKALNELEIWDGSIIVIK